MKIPITQTEDWKKLQDDLKEVSFFEKGKGFQYLAILKNTPVGKYLYLPYGPVADSEDSFKAAIKNLNNLAKSKSAIFIRIEPQNPDFINAFPKRTKKSKDLNPKDTWVLDIAPDSSELLKNFSQGTRTRYNTYPKKGLTVEKTTNTEDIKILVSLQHKLAKERHIGTFSESYLKAELSQPFSVLYLVKYNKPSNVESSPELPSDDQILAASLFFDKDDTRYYMQSAADGDYKKLPATVALLSEAIFDAKEKGIKHFDFWGIAPEGADKSHPWYGFTEFKKSFGGSPVHYAGTYDVILSPAKYKLYELTRKLNRLLRRH